MKRLTYIILIISLIACQSKKSIDYAVISGKIQNTTFKTFKLEHLDTNNATTISLSDEGAFKDTLKQLKPGLYNLSFNKKSYVIYLEPAFELTIDYNATKTDSAISFSGKRS